MEIDIIFLIILGVICAVGVAFIVGLHIRNVVIVEKHNTPEEFTVLAPTLHILFCFAGFVITLALLLVFTATDIASLWIRVFFGIFALCFGIGVYATSKFSIECNDKTIIKRGMFGSKEFKKSEIVKKRMINFGFCTIVYTAEKRVFSYNQSCIGSEFLDYQFKELEIIEE